MITVAMLPLVAVYLSNETLFRAIASNQFSIKNFIFTNANRCLFICISVHMYKCMQVHVLFKAIMNFDILDSFIGFICYSTATMFDYLIFHIKSTWFCLTTTKLFSKKETFTDL